jgi:hypothetical protein
MPLRYLVIQIQNMKRDFQPVVGTGVGAEVGAAVVGAEVGATVGLGVGTCSTPIILSLSGKK